ncbi:hypothetical protein [Streptomyces niveus]|nr:hypothetical protein [Streptomyces niveus]
MRYYESRGLLPAAPVRRCACPRR